MIRITLYLSLLGLVVLAMACGSPRYYSSPGDEMYMLADYDDTVHNWSSHDELHHRFIGIADLNCIYRSWEVKQAYLAAMKNRMQLDTDDLERAAEREILTFNRGNEFYLGLYCYEEKWNKLTGMNPVWQLTLCSDTASPVKPILIEKINLRPEEAWFYLNFLSHGREIYRVIFPHSDDQGRELIGVQTSRFHLRCNSLLGELRCKWTMKPIPEGLR